MTSSISAISSGRRGMLRAAGVYLSISIFCVLFNAIYAQYSHEVSSPSMSFMFVYPLAGGTLISLLFSAVKKLPLPGRFATNSYNSGIATLTAGSAVKGVFEIAGTSSPYQPVFIAMGMAMVAGAIAAYLLSAKSEHSGEKI